MLDVRCDGVQGDDELVTNERSAPSLDEKGQYFRLTWRESIRACNHPKAFFEYAALILGPSPFIKLVPVFGAVECLLRSPISIRPARSNERKRE